MALALKTPAEVKTIVKNLRLALGDINKLSIAAYRFISGCPGFIAHTDLNGFRIEYWNTGKLAHDVFMNRYINQWDNFHPGEDLYEYMMQKRGIYNQVLDAMKELYPSMYYHELGMEYMYYELLTRDTPTRTTKPWRGMVIFNESED